MTARSRWIVRAFGLAGLGFAGAAAWVHYRLLTDPSYVSPCDINATFNCSQLYLSRYGSVRGVPVALGGMFWFGLVSLLAWLGPQVAGEDRVEFPASRTRGDRKPAASRARSSQAATTAAAIDGYLFVLATLGLAAILYLGFASYRLHTICVLCVGTYVCVIGIFMTTGLSATAGLGRLPLRVMEDLRHMTAKPVAMLATLLFVTAAATVVAFFPKDVKAVQAAPLSQDAETAFRTAWEAQPRAELGVPADGAKVIVVKFNDWLCPSCKYFHQIYLPVLDKYAKDSPGAVKYVVKDWLWNNRCNPFTQTIPGHEGACEAAASVRIARDRGKGDEMIAWLFANQERLVESAMGAQNTPANASAAAIKAEAMKLLGITDQDFDREYTAKLKDIQRDEADGNSLNVHSTPTYFVDGVRLVDGNGNNLPPQYFDMSIKLELAKPAGK